MLLSKRRVTAPDGTEWEVSVDWTRRPVRLPHAYRLGTGRKDAGDVASSALDIPSTEHRWQLRGVAAARRTIDEVADRLAAGLGAASYE